jgi:hypothetical protein
MITTTKALFFGGGWGRLGIHINRKMLLPTNQNLVEVSHYFIG